MNRLFRRKNKVAKVTQPEPRKIEDIQKSYSELLSKAAQTQYLVYVHSEELKNINQALVSVNQEAAARQSLDRAAEASKPAETGATNE
jgi:hypothetical protein